MLKMLLTLVGCLALLGGSLVAGGKDLKNAKMQEAIQVEPAPAPVQTQGSQGAYIPGLDQATAITWFPVDSMANAFGPANNGVKPLSYDPASNVLTMIHRGDASYASGGSGQLWYNRSLNGGTSWRRVGELNGGTPNLLRYPSSQLINAPNSADTADVWNTWVAPRLDAAGTTFGGATYGFDFVGANTAYAVPDDGPDFTFRSELSIWGAPGNSTIYWGTRRGGTSEFYLWYTTDYSVVTAGSPPTWLNANFSNPLAYIVGKARGNVSQFGVFALWPGDSADLVLNFGYSRSTNNGSTWSAWSRPQPDWVRATGLPLTVDLMDYIQPPGGTVSYIADMLLDANNRGHFFTVIVDSPWTLADRRSILEVYETGSGWASKYVTQDLNELTALGYPGTTTTPYLDQTHNAIHASISPNGDLMTLVWLDAPTPTSTVDTLPDIWMSYRYVTDASWSAPVNLTQTPNFMEILLHAAPLLKSNGGNSYTLFLGRSYTSGRTTYPPDNVARTTFFVGSHTFTANPTSVGDELGSIPGTFALTQNFPNPFNPSTSITYTVGSQVPVHLSVYNVLGQEVATLVNEVKSPGTYDVSFGAEGLTSGVYFYTLKAGQFSETKKMVLMK